MADALDSKSSEVTLVWVRVPPSVLASFDSPEEASTPVFQGFSFFEFSDASLGL